VSCSNCGATLVPGAKFCPECGTRQAIACPSCGTPSAPGTRFCSECGTGLAAVNSATPTTADQPATIAQGEPSAAFATGRDSGAQRRVVSVLFADLVGFTSLSEGRDHEAVREILTNYFEHATGIIERHGGMVEKFIGDAVMAVWGAPIAHEDDAERAVRAALELVDGVALLGPGIQARAAVLTGETAVTVGATNQGLVAGDIVNTASRLQGIAEPGTVVVGASTAHAAAAAIAFESLGEHELKGKAEPVEVFRALRVVAQRGGRRRADVLEAPFVGRDSELRLLKDLFHATERESRSRLVSMIGPAGIGKSRLAWEFAKYLDGIVGKVLWHQGRAPAYGEGMTFWSLGEMVRGRAGLAETDDERTTRRLIGEMVAAHVPDETERRWIEPALLALLGIDAGSTGPEQLFAAWRTFFERLASESTVVLLFEDLHWADSGTLDFIDHLLEWSRSSRLFVITLARPDLLIQRSAWGAGKRNFTSVDLEPLTDASMRQLLDGLVPGLPDDAVAAIIGRADGIPLYAVETVRMLVAENHVRVEDGRYVPVGDLRSVAIPETLTALIAARLDGLDPLDRALLQDAAVLGQSFTPAGLAAVSGLEPAAIEEHLRNLVRAEVFNHEIDPRSPERGQYAFVQALIREVAYNTLSRKDRKTRHLAAARFFEGLETEELAGALAGHFLSARANADGEEADALATQARLALKGAADRASALGSHEQAARFLAQAIEVARGPLDEAELLQAAGIALTAAGRYDDAQSRLRRAIALQDEHGGRFASVLASASLARALVAARQTQDAIDILDPIATAVESDADVPRATLAGVLNALAAATNRNGQPARGLDVAERVLEIAERDNLTEELANALVTKGSALAALGRRVEGLGLLRVGGELADSAGYPLIAARSLGNQGAMLIDDPRAALAVERAAIEVAQRLGQRPLLTTNIQNAAEDALRTGEWDWSVGTLEATLGEDLDASDRAAILGALARYRCYRGGTVDVEIDQIERIDSEANDPELHASIEGLHADINLVAGKPALARTHARGAASSRLNAPLQLLVAARAAVWARDARGAAEDLADLEALGSGHGKALDLSETAARAGIAALNGDTGTAHRLFDESLRAARDLGLQWDEALIAIDMASVLDPADPDVRDAASAARHIFERLRATPMLAILDELMAGRSAAGAPTSDRSGIREDGGLVGDAQP
jgi:class 3 adenylate cyclase/tetratricopeptide (TPR) repeat protein